jgi:O-antigen ligase
LKYYFKYDYLYIFFVIIWHPFQKLILKIDAASYTISLLTIGIIAAHFSKKQFYKLALKKPALIWLIWVIYAFLNTLSNGLGYEDNLVTAFTIIFVPYVLIVIISSLYLKNFKRLLDVLIFSFFVSLSIILFFDYKNLIIDRLSGEVHANETGIMATLLIMLLYLKYFNKWLKFINLLFLSILPLSAILITASRTALGGVALLILSHYIINSSKSFFGVIMNFIFGAGILFIPITYLLNNTTIGERILSTTEQSEGLGFESGNFILDNFGDRGVFYYYGWKVFEESPITGVGLGNYRFFNSAGLGQHSEYMIQLAELGIIGFFLFIAFYYQIFKNLAAIKRVSSNRKEANIYRACIIIILVMITATRMYRVWQLFIIVALCIGFIKKKKISFNQI